jgi:hypothetical protein
MQLMCFTMNVLLMVHDILVNDNGTVQTEALFAGDDESVVRHSTLPSRLRNHYWMSLLHVCGGIQKEIEATTALMELSSDQRPWELVWTVETHFQGVWQCNAEHSPVPTAYTLITNHAACNLSFIPSLEHHTLTGTSYPIEP